DTDVDGDTLTVTSVTGAAHGPISNPSPGSFTYDPDPNWFGLESLSYTISDGNGGTASANVTVTITAVNDPPVANPNAFTIAEDSGALALNVTGNDTDADGDTLTVTSVTGAAHGTIANPSAGVYTYDPDPNWFGLESLTYTVSDGNGGTDTSTIAVTVTSVNDPPVANNDTLTIAEDSGPATLDLLTNDTDIEGDTLTVTAVTALNGTITSPGGVWTYTPNANFNGTDTLTYTVSDGNGGTDTGTMTVTVTPVNDPPVANNDTVSIAEDSVDAPLNLLGNDTDVDGDPLTVTSMTATSPPAVGVVTQQPDGSWTYTAEPDWNGTETFNYDISDGNGGTATAKIAITVTPVNDPPVAGPDAYSTQTGQLLAVNAANGVLSNDSDADGDTLTVTGDDSLSVTINADGSFTYLSLLPTTEVVHYTVSDGTVSSTGTLTITVTLLPTSIIQLFMQPANSVTTGALTTTPPLNGVGDYDFDSHPGLTIKKGNLDQFDTDTDKYQNWSYPVPAGGVSLNGPITMTLWSSTHGETNKDVSYAAWVYDCNG
ncbi:MAG: Ig-like domain-containing protein, partial [Nocardioidaceae bacterium]